MLFLYLTHSQKEHWHSISDFVAKATFLILCALSASYCFPPSLTFDFLLPSFGQNCHNVSSWVEHLPRQNDLTYLDIEVFL